jgi:hypothetical protein
MKKYIVTTTINKPSSATLGFIKKKDWNVIVVGDTKTPHDLYDELSRHNGNFKYMSPFEQEQKYPDLSAVLGWKTIERRNVGFVEAFNTGADVIATVDDDNIPYENWGSDILVNDTREIDIYSTDQRVFDPLSPTNHNNLWHRGFPIQLVEKKNDIKLIGKNWVHVDVQADLWDGDPDIDAIERIAWHPCVKFNVTDPYIGNVIAPFNSQNTILSRRCFPFYSVLPFVGRMDDIFGAYVLQAKLSGANIVYNKASVYQARNVQDLTVNMRKEYIGYEYALELIDRLQANGGNIADTGGIIPKETVEFFEIYKKAFII